MISMDLYKKLRKQWSGRIYQDWNMERKRFHHFGKIAKMFGGRNVLEIGSNAGVQTLELCEHAKSVIAIEPDKEKFEQLKITMKHNKNPNVELFNGSLMDFAATDNKQYDALFTSFVIYHFSDEEIKVFAEKVLPRANLWVLYNRAKKRNPKNSYRFENCDNTVEFMKKNGFTVKAEWQRAKIWYFIIVTRK
jgi:cyclopropane fatty-acyl-phospholipid synthase-like methyltransferase